MLSSGRAWQGLYLTGKCVRLINSSEKVTKRQLVESFVDQRNRSKWYVSDSQDVLFNLNFTIERLFCYIFHSVNYHSHGFSPKVFLSKMLACYSCVTHKQSSMRVS